VADAKEGHMDPREADPKLFASARDKEIDMAKLARAAVEAPDLRAFLEKQPPQHRYYKSLIPALARYREIAANEGWPAVPKGPSLKPGMTDPRIPVVRKRLSITGDLSASDLTGEHFDEQLTQAVKQFQERHYLTADGVIGKNTLKAMNVSAEKRVRQIIINMERWRWTSIKPQGKQIFVNIAGFHLVGMEGEALEMRMPVIVGKERHMTPVFSDTIEYIEFNPFWNVPVSIARNEYLPKLRRNPRALQDKNIRIFSGWDENAKEVDPTTIDWKNVSPAQMGRYRLRQDPGPWNALGTVKFMFPNAYSVYLHDTPGHALFQREKRTFSHGCIRVSQPPELAVYVLGSQEEGWTLERVKEIVNSQERKVVNLKKTMPVHILYRTVVALDDNLVLFGEDVYGRDAILEKALF
jgi:murein L,D-transpeptidase YcbB/YkuD